MLPNLWRWLTTAPHPFLLLRLRNLERADAARAADMANLRATCQQLAGRIGHLSDRQLQHDALHDAATDALVAVRSRLTTLEQTDREVLSDDRWRRALDQALRERSALDVTGSDQA